MGTFNSSILSLLKLTFKKISVFTLASTQSQPVISQQSVPHEGCHLNCQFLPPTLSPWSNTFYLVPLREPLKFPSGQNKHFFFNSVSTSWLSKRTNLPQWMIFKMHQIPIQGTGTDGVTNSSLEDGSSTKGLVSSSVSTPFSWSTLQFLNHVDVENSITLMVRYSIPKAA